MPTLTREHQGTSFVRGNGGKLPEIKWGAIRGRIPLDDVVLARARQMADEFYAQREADEFAGESVEPLPLADWLPARESWFPTEALSALGLRKAKSSWGEELVLTLGTDHVDDIHRPVLFLVLANNGLSFRQGKCRHETQPGEWFVFNDRQRHVVMDTKRSTTYLGWAVPLEWDVD